MNASRILSGLAVLAASLLFAVETTSAQVARDLPLRRAEPNVQVQQPQPADAEPGERPAPDQPAQPKEKVAPKNETPEEPPAEPKEPVNPREIRVFLMDGSVIAGELAIDQIEVETEFGNLTIPVEKIVSITPGLDSHSALSARIDQLIDDLGGADYKGREAAHKELLKLGQPVRDILAPYLKDKDAERKRHATEIVEKLDEMSGDDDFDFNGSSNSRKWVRHDTVVTPGFTVAGKINPQVFGVKSKYGPLKVSLNDIQRTERQNVDKEPTIRQLTVAGTNLMLRSPKSSQIRVEAGDTITVNATGQIVMTPWGSNSVTGPEGNSRFGSYNTGGQNFFGGALAARIGDGANWVKVGNKARFTAKNAGVLKFGIAMQTSYAGGNYAFPGNYKLKIRVEPKN